MSEPRRLVEMFDGSFLDLDAQLRIYVAPCWSAGSTKLLGYQAVMSPVLNTKSTATIPVGPRRITNIPCSEQYTDDISAPLQAAALQDIKVFAHAAGYKICSRDTSLFEVEAYQHAQQRLQQLQKILPKTENKQKS